MGLSEFISRNQECPNPKIEWEQSKLLVKTLVESGVSLLLGQLADSILSNPRFEHFGINELRRLLFVNNPQGVAKFANLDSSALDFQVLEANKLMQKVPCARIEFKYYRFQEVRPREGFLEPWVSTYYNYLSAECDIPDKLTFCMRIEGARDEFTTIILEKQQWRQRGAVDKTLGQLYAKSPANKKY